MPSRIAIRGHRDRKERTKNWRTLNESKIVEKKDSPKEFEKKVVHTVSIMKKYPANKNKSDAVLRKGAIKYLTQKPRGASDDWNESLDLARLKLLLGR